MLFGRRPAEATGGAGHIGGLAAQSHVSEGAEHQVGQAGMPAGRPTTTLSEIAHSDPSRTAIVFMGKKITYGQLDSRSSRLSQMFMRMGVQPGEMIAVMLPNCPELFECLYAASKVAAEVTFLDPSVDTDLLQHAIGQGRAKVLVTHVHTWEEHGAFTLLPGNCKVMLVGGSSVEFVGTATAAVPADYEAALAAIGPVVEQLEARPAIGWSIFHREAGLNSSGRILRSSVSAGEALSAQNRRISLWDWKASDVFLLAGPASHPGFLCWAVASFQVGATVVMMGKWSATNWLDSIEQFKVTRSFVFPRYFFDIVECAENIADYDLSSLKTVIHGGAPCPVAVKLKAVELLAPSQIWEIYGQADQCVSRIGSDEWLEHPGSVGTPLSGVTLEIVDTEGRSLPPGRRGLVRWTVESTAPQQLTKGHLGSRKRVEKPVEFHGGTHVGYLDEAGYLYIQDRSSDIVRKGSTVVYPWEVEEVLYGNTGIIDCVAFGMGRSSRDEELWAVAKVREGTSVEALLEHCRRYLPESKCPDRIEIAEELDRDAFGKVGREAMRERFVDTQRIIRVSVEHERDDLGELGAPRSGEQVSSSGPGAFPTADQQSRSDLGAVQPAQNFEVFPSSEAS